MTVRSKLLFALSSPTPWVAVGVLLTVIGVLSIVSLFTPYSVFGLAIDIVFYLHPSVDAPDFLAIAWTYGERN
jgi:hypothetical protein